MRKTASFPEQGGDGKVFSENRLWAARKKVIWKTAREDEWPLYKVCVEQKVCIKSLGKIIKKAETVGLNEEGPRGWRGLREVVEMMQLWDAGGSLWYYCSEILSSSLVKFKKKLCMQEKKFYIVHLTPVLKVLQLFNNFSAKLTRTGKYLIHWKREGVASGKYTGMKVSETLKLNLKVNFVTKSI